MKPRRCSCGKLHEFVPRTARVLKEDSELDGFYWECDCKTTLFEPFGTNSKTSEEDREQDKYARAHDLLKGRNQDGD
jgi:hypothetical protein